jgi:putative transposase
MTATGVPERQIVRQRVAEKLRAAVDADPARKWQLVVETAETVGVDESTVWRWLNRDPKPLGRPRGSGKLIFDDALKGLYYACGCNAQLFLERASAARCFVDGSPSVSTVRRAIKTQLPRVERELAQHGDRGLRDNALVFLPIEVPYRANTYLLDHCELPWYVLPPPPYKKPVKPWFTGVMDAKTRAIMGFAISLQPNSTTIGVAMAAAVAPDPDGRDPFQGIPENVLIDNGNDFLSTHFGQAMLTIGSVLTPHVGYHPHIKGKLERFHYTLRRRMQGLPGFADGPKTVDGRRRFVREDGWMHFSEVYGVVREIVDGYHDTVHRELGCSPKEAWQRDPTPLRIVESREAVSALLMKVSARKVTKNGISMFGKYFTCAQISARKGDVLEVRYWPHDPREIYLYEGGSLIGTAVEPLEMTQEEKQEFWVERDRQVREANRRVREQKRAHRLAFAPLVESGKDPDLVAVGAGGRLDTTARTPSGAKQIVDLAFGPIDESFPVEVA